jgi:hypothetical protein
MKNAHPSQAVASGVPGQHLVKKSIKYNVNIIFVLGGVYFMQKCQFQILYWTPSALAYLGEGEGLMPQGKFLVEKF